jgi:hypothetical protein
VDDAPLDELRRFWDEVARGAPADRGGLDPELADAVLWLHAHAAVPPPDPAYATRLREALMRATSAPLPLAVPPAGPGRNGRTAPPAPRAVPGPSPAPREASPFTRLATAALLLLVVVGGGVAFGSGWPGRPSSVPLVLPAVGGTPATPEAAAWEAIVAAEVDLPVGRARVAVDRYAMRPGLTGLSVPAVGGPTVVAIEAGAVGAAVAGAERPLGAGEHLVLGGDRAAELRVVGAGEASVLVAYLGPGFGEYIREFRYDPVDVNQTVVVDSSADGLPPGPARLALERLTLPPGAALPPFVVPEWSWVGLGSGQLGLTLEGEGLPYGWASGEEREVQAWMNVPPPAPGARTTLRNAGDGPLVLYRLSLTPAP